MSSNTTKLRNIPLTTDRVATSLCRLLFDAPKANDALLFMTILSTDLRALKRRGYNGEHESSNHNLTCTLSSFGHHIVDRILRQQKADRAAAEDAARANAENTALVSSPPQGAHKDSLPLPPIPSMHSSSPDDSNQVEKGSGKQEHRPLSIFQNLKRMGSKIHPTGPEKSGQPQAPQNNMDGPAVNETGAIGNDSAPIQGHTSSGQRHNTSTVTPLSNICELPHRPSFELTHRGF